MDVLPFLIRNPLDSFTYLTLLVTNLITFDLPQRVTADTRVGKTSQMLIMFDLWFISLISL